MKKSVVVAAAALAALVGGVSIAAASGETASVNYNVKGKFSKKEYKPAKLSFGVKVSTSAVQILPMKLADMKFPPKATMTFMPKKGLPVCKATETQLSVSPAAAYAACGKSAIGMGLATFALAQNTGAARDGTVVIFYGGKVGGNVKIRFSAWSDQTNAGVYAEGILKPNGSMQIEMPRLTADSSVTSLNLEIPGRNLSGNYGGVGSYSLKKGLDAGFVRVKCKQGQTLNFSSKFELGARSDTGNPIGPTTNLTAASSSKCGS